MSGAMATILTAEEYRAIMVSMLDCISAVTGAYPALDHDPASGNVRLLDYDGNNLWPNEGYITPADMMSLLQFAGRITGAVWS